MDYLQGIYDKLNSSPVEKNSNYLKYLEVVYKKICAWFQIREFVFRFDIYNGTESSNQIYDAAVVEYEFVNQGTTVCVINDGLFLYPQYTGIPPFRLISDIKTHERDATIYNYRFQPVDYSVQYVAMETGLGLGTASTPVVTIGSVVQPQPFNRLMVKSKVIAKVQRRPLFSHVK
jgi:hypothetical protein